MKKHENIAELENQFNPNPEVVNLRALNSELKAQVKSLKQEIGDRSDILAEVLEAVKATRAERSVYRERKDITVDSECEVCLHLTDWHIGQKTVGDEVEGFNEFSYDIAIQRVNLLGNKLVSWTDLHRHAYKIPKLHVLFTGDAISGDIHDELRVTNEFPTPEQSVKAGYLLADLLAMLAPHFQQIEMDFITLDNHGRLTRKPQKAQGGFNNFGFIVASVAKERASRLGNVDVRIHPVSNKIITVAGQRYLCGHGHGIKGWAGIPFYGIARKVGKEAEVRMNMPEDKRFDRLVIGHFHVALNHAIWMIGGSLSGTDANDHAEGRHSRAHQSAWIVHPRHGEFDWTRFWL